jgi:cytochrome c oxidase assembly factor CtaG
MARRCRGCNCFDRGSGSYSCYLTGLLRVLLGLRVRYLIVRACPFLLLGYVLGKASVLYQTSSRRLSTCDLVCVLRNHHPRGGVIAILSCLSHSLPLFSMFCLQMANERKSSKVAAVLKALRL